MASAFQGNAFDSNTFQAGNEFTIEYTCTPAYSMLRGGFISRAYTATCSAQRIRAMASSLAYAATGTVQALRGVARAFEYAAVCTSVRSSYRTLLRGAEYVATGSFSRVRQIQRSLGYTATQAYTRVRTVERRLGYTATQAYTRIRQLLRTVLYVPNLITYQLVINSTYHFTLTYVAEGSLSKLRDFSLLRGFTASGLAARVRSIALASKEYVATGLMQGIDQKRTYLRTFVYIAGGAAARIRKIYKSLAINTAVVFSPDQSVDHFIRVKIRQWTIRRPR